jgi:2-polyprenyl-3-methyl-5-hydroxy-6-metoxy-1,4-benzoquinol methylase
MKYSIDPERNEVRALRAVTSWKGKRVLEIGCGDGRLTRRLAALGAQVDAIDPDAALVREARRSTPPRLAGRITYHVGSAGRLRFSSGRFEVVLFAWSF